MKLNVKAITIAERLLGKSFMDMNFVEADTLDALMYSMSISDGGNYTLKGFKLLMKNRKHRQRMEGEVEDALLFLSQFKKEPTESEKDTASISITEIANILIASGVSAEYVMEDMHVFEVEDLMKSLSDKKKERLEESRLWTFYGLLPYAGKNMKNPADLIKFPWEGEIKEAEFEKGLQLFEKFMKSESLKD